MPFRAADPRAHVPHRDQREPVDHRRQPFVELPPGHGVAGRRGHDRGHPTSVDCLERGLGVLGRRPAPRRILLQASRDDLGQPWRKARELLFFEWLRRVVEHRRPRCQGTGITRMSERVPAGQQLVEQDTEREQVGASVERLAPQLLGRHVLRRAHPLIRARAAQRVRGSGASTLAMPKSSTFQLPVDVPHHVLGLQIAVHDPLPVRGAERVQHGEPDGESRPPRTAARRRAARAASVPAGTPRRCTRHRPRR